MANNDSEKPTSSSPPVKKVPKRPKLSELSNPKPDPSKDLLRWESFKKPPTKPSN